MVSPIDGMVLRRQVEIGEVVQSGKTSLTGGTVLIELADVSSVYAVVNVDEADIGLVRDLAPQEARPGYATMPADTASRPEGEESGEVAVSQPVELPEGVIAMNQSVELEIESFPSESFSGVIERIAPQSDISQAIATFKVWIRVTGDNRSKLVGLLNVQAEAHFKAKSVSDAILVSYDAFQKNPDGDGFGVYVPAVDPRTGKKNRKEFRPCVFGRDNGINVEVIEGLKEGEEVWTKLPINRDKDESESSR